MVKLALAAAGLVWAVALLFWGQLTGALFVAGASVFLGLNDGWRLFMHRGCWQPMQADEAHVIIGAVGMLGVGLLIASGYFLLVSRPIEGLSALLFAVGGAGFVYAAVTYFREHPPRRKRRD